MVLCVAECVVVRCCVWCCVRVCGAKLGVLTAGTSAIELRVDLLDSWDLDYVRDQVSPPTHLLLYLTALSECSA